MTAISKATKFIQLCKENGWQGEREFDYENDFALVKVHRDHEILEIEWLDNQLTGPPKYSYNGITVRLHCAATARKNIERSPEIARRQESQVKRRAPRLKSSFSSSQTSSIPMLPFTIGETPDREILRVCRNKTLVWWSDLMQAEQQAHIPKTKNVDLHNVYYIGETSVGKEYLSFCDENGSFRAVSFSAMLRLQ